MCTCRYHVAFRGTFSYTSYRHHLFLFLIRRWSLRSCFSIPMFYTCSPLPLILQFGRDESSYRSRLNFLFLFLPLFCQPDGILRENRGPARSREHVLWQRATFYIFPVPYTFLVSFFLFLFAFFLSTIPANGTSFVVQISDRRCLLPSPCFFVGIRS